MNRYLTIGLLLAGLLGLALRGPHLGQRPLHNDEAVNAVKFAQLWQGGGYAYDPNEHHGPSLYYAALALGRLSGGPDVEHFSDARLRAVTVLFGLGLVGLLPLLVDGLGRRGLVWAGLFTAVSPALVFYSRYFIHETLLVFFTFLALGAGWRYWRTRCLGWALLAGAALGLMQATKETFVLTLGAAAVALLLSHTWNRVFDASGLPVRAQRLNWKHLAGALAMWLAVVVVLVSSFFTHPAGLLDTLRTFQPWLQRAGGASPHIHPWSFYLQRLLFFHAPGGPLWTEGLLLGLALVAGWAGFARRRLGRANATFVRFLLLYAFVLGGIYSLLPYKTPWCLLSFWHATVLLAGVGAAVLLRGLRRRRWRLVVATLLLAGAAHLLWQSWLLNGRYAADRRNPYVYAQTSPDLARLLDKVQALAQLASAEAPVLLKVMAPESDYWPLPWSLRALKHVGWWDQVPAEPFAPLMIVSAQLHAGLDEKKTHLMVGYFELRPQVFLELYVQRELWQAYLAKHPPSRGDGN